MVNWGNSKWMCKGLAEVLSECILFCIGQSCHEHQYLRPIGTGKVLIWGSAARQSFPLVPVLGLMDNWASSEYKTQQLQLPPPGWLQRLFLSKNLPWRLANPPPPVDRKHADALGYCVAAAAPSEWAWPTPPQFFMSLCLCVCPVFIPSSARQVSRTKPCKQVSLLRFFILLFCWF